MCTPNLDKESTLFWIVLYKIHDSYGYKMCPHGQNPLMLEIIKIIDKGFLIHESNLFYNLQTAQNN